MTARARAPEHEPGSASARSTEGSTGNTLPPGEAERHLPSAAAVREVALFGGLDERDLAPPAPLEPDAELDEAIAKLRALHGGDDPFHYDPYEHEPRPAPPSERAEHAVAPAPAPPIERRDARGPGAPALDPDAPDAPRVIVRGDGHTRRMVPKAGLGADPRPELAREEAARAEAKALRSMKTAPSLRALSAQAPHEAPPVAPPLARAAPAEAPAVAVSESRAPEHAPRHRGLAVLAALVVVVGLVTLGVSLRGQKDRAATQGPAATGSAAAPPVAPPTPASASALPSTPPTASPPTPEPSTSSSSTPTAEPSTSTAPSSTPAPASTSTVAPRASTPAAPPPPPTPKAPATAHPAPGKPLPKPLFDHGSDEP